MPSHWKNVVGYEGIYFVSDSGEIKRNNKLLTPINVDGYNIVNLCLNGKVKRGKVHRLVMQAFKPIDNDDIFHVNHINFIRNDNRPDNLEWVTPADNTRHSAINGRYDKHIANLAILNTVIQSGSNAPNAKLTDYDVLAIRKLYANGEMNQPDLAKKYNINGSQISKIITRKQWKLI